MSIDEILDLDNCKELDNKTRPQTFDTFIGQKDLVKQLKIAIQAAKERDDPVPHCIFSGKSGYGKSTLGNIIANEYGCECKTIMAPSIRNVADILEVLVKIKRNTVLLLDECHQLNQKIEESLYSALEDFKATIRTANKNVVHIPINPFCMVAATNQLGAVSEPLRNRFGIVGLLEDYSIDELVQIVEGNSEKIGAKLENKDVAYNIANRARSTPRLINRLLNRIADFAQLYNNGLINNNCVEEAMKLEGIDKNGLTNLDRAYLKSLYKNFAGSAGINSLSSTLAVDKQYLEEYIEPVLIKANFIVKTRSGRVITEGGLKYIL